MALVDFTVTVLESYYRHRLLDFAHSVDKKAAYTISRELVVCTGVHTYSVPSADASDLYGVDAVAGICSCFDGMCSRCCKHHLFEEDALIVCALIVHRLLGDLLPNMPAVRTTARYQAAVLALGGTAGAVKIQWSPAQRIKISLAPQQLQVSCYRVTAVQQQRQHQFALTTLKLCAAALAVCCMRRCHC